MSYYDNVKDNVKDKKSGASNKPSFDTLKEAAEETSVEEDENSDDGTPIEVLEEGGLREQSSSQQKSSQQASSSPSDSKMNRSKDASQTVQNADMSSIEQKLDKMIEQNQRIIEVLESFGT